MITALTELVEKKYLETHNYHEDVHSGAYKLTPQGAHYLKQPPSTQPAISIVRAEGGIIGGTISGNTIHNGDFQNNPKKTTRWFWWVMGIIGTVVAGLILAQVFGVGK